MPVNTTLSVQPPPNTTKPEEQLLTVRVNTPLRVLWEGEATSVSSTNSKGPFDILPYHGNFITVVQHHQIRIKTKEKIIEYRFDQSVIYTHDNLVIIFTHL